MSEPLQGLKVVDLSWVVAGPLIGRTLAEYGATVVRVESSRRIDTARMIGPFHEGKFGPENSALYGNVNVGKLGLTLDLTDERAREVVRDLVRWGDVLIESFSPGTMQKWGLGYETLRELKPDLVMLSTSLMGASGPYAPMAGYGNIGAAMSGFQYIAGWPDRPPRGPFGPYTDFVGPRFALTILLATLDQRRRTGEGAYIDLSQAEAGIHFFAPAILDYLAQGRVAERQGNRDPEMAPHGVYTCARAPGGEERWVAIAVRDDAQWERLAVLIGGEDLAGDVRYQATADRLARADELDGVVEAWTSGQRAQEVERQLQALGIPAAVVANSEDALTDPQLQARGHFVRLGHPLHGTTTVETSRYALSETPAVIRRAAPTFDQDRATILGDLLGYGAERIAALETAGIFQ